MKSSTLGKIDSEERLRIIDAMYEDNEEELQGYRARYAEWNRKNDWRYEIEGGDPSNEKPRRLQSFN